MQLSLLWRHGKGVWRGIRSVSCYHSSSAASELEARRTRRTSGKYVIPQCSKAKTRLILRSFFLVSGNPSDFGSNAGDTPANAISVTEQEALEDIDIEKLLEVNSSIAVEKEIAADTFGSLFEFTRGHFLPFLEESTLELVDLLKHYYEGIRKSSVETLLEYVRTFYDLSEPEEWQPGAAVVCCSHSNLNSLLIRYSLSPLILEFRAWLTL
jgi:hypothetical protein